MIHRLAHRLVLCSLCEEFWKRDPSIKKCVLAIVKNCNCQEQPNPCFFFRSFFPLILCYLQIHKICHFLSHSEIEPMNRHSWKSQKYIKWIADSSMDYAILNKCHITPYKNLFLSWLLFLFYFILFYYYYFIRWFGSGPAPMGASPPHSRWVWKDFIYEI